MLNLDKVFEDFFDRRLLRYWIKTLIIALLVLGPLLLWLGLGVFAVVSDFAVSIAADPAGKVEQAFWLTILLGAVHIVVGVLLTGVLGILFLHLFVMLSLFIIGFFTEDIVKQVRDKHYPGVSLDGTMTVFDFGLFMAKSLIKHLLVLILLLPLLLIPAVNGLIIVAWLFSMYRSALLVDVGGNVFDKQQLYKQISLFEPRYYPATAASYFAGLVPLLNLAAPYLAVIWLSHILLDNKDSYIAESGA